MAKSIYVLALLSWHLRAATTQARRESRSEPDVATDNGYNAERLRRVWQVGSTRLDVTEALAHDMLRGMGGAAATTPGHVGKGVVAVQGRRLDAVRPRRRRCGAPCRSRLGKGAAAVQGRSLSLEGAEG